MRKKSVAVMLMIIMILVAIPLGVSSSMIPQRNEAKEEYTNDETGFSIPLSVSARTDAAENIYKIAEKYSGDSDYSHKLDDLDRAINLVRQTNAYDDPAGLAHANNELTAPAQAMVNELKSMSDVKASDVSMVENQLTEMESQQYKLNRSSYNSAAKEYNKKLEQFPLSLLKHASFLMPLDLFELS